MTSILYGYPGVAMIECAGRFSSHGMGAFVPSGDSDRAIVAGVDPCPGMLKVIVIRSGGDETVVTADQFARISPDGAVTVGGVDPATKAAERLDSTHSSMTQLPSNHRDEYMEQLMSCMHLRGSERVLELGGNIGRNTAVLGQIMKTAGAGGSITTLETLKREAAQLESLVQTNGFNVRVVNAALSRTELVQSVWSTFPKGAPGTEGLPSVPTITLEELASDGDFDTLVVDCEGALEPILDEWPELLETARVIQIENDFRRKESADKVMAAMEKAGFRLWFSRPLEQNMAFPLRHQFYQIYTKQEIAI